MSFLKRVEAIICEPGTPVAKASAIWMHTMGGDEAHYETALYIFEVRVSKGFYNSPKERFQQLLSRSKSGDNAAKREAIEILTDCLEEIS
jgi:hypothetical protein